MKFRDLGILWRLFAYIRPLKGWLITALVASVLVSLLTPLMVFLSEIVVKPIFAGPAGVVQTADALAPVEADAPGTADAAPAAEPPETTDVKESIKEFFLGPILERVRPYQETDPFRVVIIVGLSLIGLAVLKGVFSFVQEYAMSYVCSKAILELQADLFKHMTTLSLGYFSSRHTGEIMSVIVADVELFGQTIRAVFLRLLVEPINIVVLLGAAFISAPLLTLTFILVLGPMILVGYYFGRVIRKARRKRQERVADLTAVLQQSFSAIRVVKAFSMEGHEYQRFYTQARRAFRQIMKVVKARALASPIIEVMGTASVALILIIGGWFILAPNPTVRSEDFLACVVLLSLVYQPVKAFNRAYHQLQEGLAGGERLFNELDRRPELTEKVDAVEVTEVGDGIRYEKVRFSYDGESDALADINVTVHQGQTVAIVGPSGAGKTTFVDLLARFYDVSDGRVLIHNTDVRDIRTDSLRKLIGIVPQSVVLFNDSVYNNIRYGRWDATAEEVEQAARDANALEFIRKMPQGFETQVGERGSQISGGQAQRLAIARALLKDPPILILDEATSALDSETERLIREAIERLVQNRTTFIIAHRLSTITHADQILVLDGGRLVAKGTHAELLEGAPLYRKLYDTQFGVEGTGQRSVLPSDGTIEPPAYGDPE